VSLISPTVFIVATWIAAVCSGIGVAAAFMSAVVGYQLTENALSESNSKIAEANARQKEAELKLEQLRKLSGPRDVDFKSLQRELEGKPKAPVAIWYLPDSSDGYWFASRLAVALGLAKWEVGSPTTIPDLDEKIVEAVVPGSTKLLSMLREMPRAVNAGGQASGVTVVGDDMTTDVRSNTPYAALFQALSKSTTFGMYGSSGSQFMPVPKGTLRIVIAAKTDPMFKDVQPEGAPE
jgi:hypothetical protein